MTKLILFLSIFNVQVENDTIPLIDSNKILTQIADLNENEAYGEVISLLSDVSPYDSNYVDVQSELIDALYNDGQLEKATETGENLMSVRDDLTAGFYITLGNIYINEGLKDKAVRTYYRGLEVFPYNYTLRYNVGYSEYVVGNYDAAIPHLTEALQINPYYSYAHQLLANIMALTNQRTKAVLSYLMYLAIEPDENWALVRLNDLVSDGYREEGSLRLNLDNTSLVKYDNLLRSKAALDDRFKSSVDFEVPIAQQVELLIQKLHYEPDTQDFWMNFYVPLFEAIAKENLTQAFVYFMLYSANDEGVTAWISKHEKEKNEWIGLVQNHLNEYRLTHKRTVMDSTDVYTHWFHSNGYISAIGNESGEHNVGPFEFYFPNGRLNAKGCYNDQGNKVETWHYYHDNGQLKSVEYFNQQGEVEGVVDTYSQDGILLKQGEYVKGELTGYFKWYFPCGNLNEQYPYEKGVGNGEGRAYYEGGELKVAYRVKDGKLHGDYIRYYKSGQVSEEYFYEDDLLESNYKSYYADGTVYLTGSYEQGNKSGEWLSYHYNGLQDAIGIYKEGNKIGSWEYYYSNGNKMRIEHYDEEGKLNGLVVWYDLDGMLHSRRTYRDDILIDYSYYNKQGEVIYQNGNESGDMEYKSYYATGELLSQGHLVHGLLEGPYKVYHPNGNISQEGTMKNDKWEGSLMEYDKSGILTYASVNKEGSLEGYYRSYHKSGTVKQEGWLKNGNIQQAWLEYFMDGTIKSEYYYHEDVLHGQTNHYDPRGRRYSTETYEDGYLIGVSEYDSLGQKYNESKINALGGELETKTLSGTTIMSKKMVCGEAFGDIAYYYSNGEPDRYYQQTKTYLQTFKGYHWRGNTMVEGHFLNDERHGNWTYYLENGEIDYTSTYYNGEEQGKSRTYHENGNLKSECDRLDDERHGTCNYYDPFGQLQIRKFYRKDYGLLGYQFKLEDGAFSDTVGFSLNSATEVVKSFFPNGELAHLQEYEKGYLNGKSVYYSSEGKVLSENNYSKGMRMGDRKSYYQNGQLKSWSNYYYDEKHGEEKVYYENGQLKESISWRYGVRNGWNKLYRENGDLEAELYYRNGNEY